MIAHLRYYANMESEDAIAALLALGQTTRLDAYRLLLEQGPSGLPVTEIGTRLGVNLSTLSRHLEQLERARLLRRWRRERQIFYAVNDEGMDQLLRFLTENCCKADPSACPQSLASQ
jgi:DNA-binding transcriptional ArsR family regulator